MPVLPCECGTMGKNKRKMPEDPAVNDPCPEEGAHQADEDTATPTKHKKCKKSKKEDRQHPLEPSEHAEQMSDKKKKKKRKAEEEEEDSVLDDARPPRQKMRKMKEVDILKNEGVATKMCYTLECSLEGIQVVKKRKKDKKKKKSLQSGKKADSVTKSHDRAVNGSQLKGFCAKTGTECDENGQEAREKEEKKKTKHKKKKTGLEAGEIQNGSAEVCKANGTDSSKKTGGTVQSHEVKKDQKKHKKDKPEPDSKENHNGTADECQANATDSSERKKKKKTKKVKANEMEDTKDTESKDTTKGKDKKKKDKKMQPGQNVTPEDIVEEVKQKKKDKKKKEKIQKTLILTETTTNDEKGSEIMKEEKRSKKKKRAENTDESACNTEVAGSDVKDCGDETKPKKKKKKKSKDEQQDGAGDCDSKFCRENSELNHQNQKEDAANNPGDAQTDSRQTNNNSAQPARVGQWGTNMFKDNQRQNKFLRLLGGLKKSGDGSQPAPGPKKGLYGSLQPKEDSSSVGGQRALTYQAAAAMNRRLENDFDRALTFSARGQRGVGLGFQPDPAEGKKMHIDVNRVRSKKLD